MLMTSDEIRARLIDIAAAESAHQARDLDAELAAVMAAGGDLDALEDAQLQAEKEARRLRVERQALEQRLPEVVAAEARARLDDLAVNHADLAAGAKAQKAEILRQIDKLERALSDWTETQKLAAEVTRQAEELADQGGVKDARFGMFVSDQLAARLGQLRGFRVSCDPAFANAGRNVAGAVAV
jgi:hypothetical protein